MKTRTKKGVTLVELLVVALLSTAVLAGIYSAFIVGNRAWAHYNDSVILKKDLRRAVFGMVKELREAENIRVIKGAGSNAIHFYRPASGTISYYWSDKGDDANRLIRQSRLGKRIMAKNISEIAFYNLRDSIVVDLRASKQTKAGEIMTIALKEKVALRSKTTLFR